MSSVDLPTQQTSDFVKGFLPTGCRVLEVGCGDGQLALRLREMGYEIVGVELSTEHAATAREAGLDVRQADFLSFEEEPFDAVLFTRSLHHISSLDEAVARADDLLKPDGLLLAEEFAMEQADRRTAAWYYQTQASLMASEMPLQNLSAESSEALARWESDHLHVPPLSTGAALLAAIEARLDLLAMERTSYLYRSLCRSLSAGGPASGDLANAIFETEERLIREGYLRPVGLRIVAKKRPGRS